MKFVKVNLTMSKFQRNVNKVRISTTHCCSLFPHGILDLILSVSVDMVSMLLWEVPTIACNIGLQYALGMEGITNTFLVTVLHQQGAN